MMSVCLAFASLLINNVAATSSDNSELVQASLERLERRAPAAAPPAPIPTPAPTNNTTAPTMAPTPTPYAPIYRLDLQKTWGDDHVCLTEIEFYDEIKEVLPAEFIDVNSCWGCAVSCGNCTVDYGNPLVLFDGVADVDSPQAYFCSDFGSFSPLGENGNVVVTVRLPTRPRYYALRRADAKGNAIPKAFALEEIQMDDTWAVISFADEVAVGLKQSLSVEPLAGPAGRWWEYEDPQCMADMTLPAPSEAPLNVKYNTIPTTKAEIQNNGKAIHLDGEIGMLWLGDVKYYGKHVHIKFPSERLIGEDKNTVIGEVHIVHQKSDGKATSHLHQDGLVIIVIPLVLPYEGLASWSAPTKTEQWFNEMFSTLPIEGSSKLSPLNFTLNIFDEQLNGSYYELPAPCQEKTEDGSYNPKKPIWFLVQKPAVIRGAIVQNFKDKFPYDASVAGGFSRTYLVDGVTETVSYDALGRGHLTGTSQPGIDTLEPETLDVNELPPGMHWVPNTDYLAGFGQFQPMGEWVYDVIEVIQEAPAPAPATTAPVASGGVELS